MFIIIVYCIFRDGTNRLCYWFYGNEGLGSHIDICGTIGCSFLPESNKTINENASKLFLIISPESSMNFCAHFGIPPSTMWDHSYPFPFETLVDMLNAYSGQEQLTVRLIEQKPGELVIIPPSSIHATHVVRMFK